MLLSKSSNEIGYVRDYLQTICTVVALEQSLSQISKIRNYNFVLENFLEFIVKTGKNRNVKSTVRVLENTYTYYCK